MIATNYIKYKSTFIALSEVEYIDIQEYSDYINIYFHMRSGKYQYLRMKSKGEAQYIENKIDEAITRGYCNEVMVIPNYEEPEPEVTVEPEPVVEKPLKKKGLLGRFFQ